MADFEIVLPQPTPEELERRRARYVTCVQTAVGALLSTMHRIPRRRRLLLEKDLRDAGEERMANVLQKVRELEEVWRG